MRVLNSKLKILFKLRKEFKILNDKKWKRSVDLTKELNMFNLKLINWIRNSYKSVEKRCIILIQITIEIENRNTQIWKLMNLIRYKKLIYTNLYKVISNNFKNCLFEK